MRPKVRIIDPQSEEINPLDISQSEAQSLLSKYGYGNSNTNQQSTSIQNSETFEEMARKEELKNRKQPLQQKRSDGYTSETKWGSDAESGLNFKIEISTNMKIPK
jgi:hypothetical protein